MGQAANIGLMEETRREMAVFASDLMGAQTHAGQFTKRSFLATLFGDRRQFRNLIEDTAQACMIIDPRPGLHIVDINDAYATATLTPRNRASGDKLFQVFPDNPDTPAADGVSNLYQSLRRVVESGEAHAMGIQRYDVRDDDGRFVERHWQCRNSPVFDANGRLIYILHHAAEVHPRG